MYPGIGIQGRSAACAGWRNHQRTSIAASPRGGQLIAIGAELQRIKAYRPAHHHIARSTAKHTYGACPAHRTIAVRRTGAGGIGPVGAKAIPHTAAAIDATGCGLVGAVPELHGLTCGGDSQIHLARPRRTRRRAGYLIARHIHTRREEVHMTAGRVKAATQRGRTIALTVVEQAVPASSGRRRRQPAAKRQIAAHIHQIITAARRYPRLTQLKYRTSTLAQSQITANRQGARSAAQRKRGTAVDRHIAANAA